MQEQVSASLRSMSELAAPGNAEPRRGARQIERRYASAIGSAELAEFGAGPDARGGTGRDRWPVIHGWNRSAHRCAVAGGTTVPPDRPPETALQVSS